MDNFDALVWVPMAAGSLDGLAAGEPLTGPVRAHAANAALASAFGLDPDGRDAEEAALAALQTAAVAALTRYDEPAIAVFEVPPAAVLGADPDEAGNGGVLLGGAEAGWLRCVYTLPADAPAGARGLAVDAAWALPEVRELLGQGLLWHDPSEIGGETW